MTVRTLGLLSLIAALAVGGWLFLAQARESGPSSDAAKRAEAQASAGAAGTSFQAALPAMQAYFAEHGTYAGATLPPTYGVVVARADAASYCLQAGTGDSVQHVAGPGGTPAPGPC